MALPIKPKDTQESCNPISSNCVIWQGPDIPCIQLCNGDSVSDVVAKMAERLCTIADQLDISLLDLSCFNPIYPTPKDFQDIIQFLLNKVCSLENEPSGSITPSAACPDDCIITIAPCFQERDYLGNLITTLSLKDYVIKIGNEICSLITTINANTDAISDLDARVTYIEDNCCNTSPGSIDITTTGCIGNGVTQPIQSFLSQFETAFCNLQQITAGTNLQSAQNMLSTLCLTGQEDQFMVPGSDLALIPGWVSPPANVSDALNNLYLAVCDMRRYISSTIPSLIDCCTTPPTPASCDDVNWTFTGNGISGNKDITLYFSGNIPTGFDYCSGGTTTSISILNSTGQLSLPGEYSYDIINAINTSAPLAVDLTSGSVDERCLWYQVQVSLCVINGSVTCTRTQTIELYDTNWCDKRLFELVSPTTSSITASWTGVGIATSYTVKLYRDNGASPSTLVATWTTPTPLTTASTITHPFTGTFTTGDSYYAVLTSTQTGGNGAGTHSLDCLSSAILIP